MASNRLPRDKAEIVAINLVMSGMINIDIDKCVQWLTIENTFNKMLYKKHECESIQLISCIRYDYHQRHNRKRSKPLDARLKSWGL